MTEDKKDKGGRLAPIALEGLEFENDFGESPVGLAHFSKDQGFIAVASLVGAFVGAAVVGLPLAAVVLIAGLNDIRFASKREGTETPSEPKVVEQLPEPDAIEVSAQVVEEERAAQPIEQKPVEKPVETTPAHSLEPKASSSTAAPTSSSPLPPEQWTGDLIGYPSILLYGAQGAGKTSTAAWLIRERIKAEHQIKILDPHRSYGQWDGLECIGDGMDYDAINDELKAFTDEIKARYKARAKTPNYNPHSLTLVCDEFTQWAKKCSHSATFFEECLTDIRKINLHVLFISHARTLTGLGGSSGLAATRDAGLLELELEAQVDPVTKKASPKLLGWLKYPGMPQDKRQRVAIASWMNGSMDFSEAGVTSTVVHQPATVVEPNAERQPQEEAIASTEPTIELKVSDSLGEPLKTIWLFAKKKNDWVTVRNIYDQKMKVLEGKKVEQIHQYLGLLADSGLGEIDEEGKSHSSVGFRAY